jgi:hypothetical protein
MNLTLREGYRIKFSTKVGTVICLDSYCGEWIGTIVVSFHCWVQSSFIPNIYLWLYSPREPRPLFQFLNLYTVGMTPWTGDQPVARPLPTRRTTQTEWTHTGMHASSGIRTHHPSIRAGEEGSCLRQRGHCGRLIPNLVNGFMDCRT